MMKLLEEVLFLCNKVVVYLEQVRDIYSIQKVASGDPTVQEKQKQFPDRVLIDEIIKKYFYARPKILNFYKAWKRFDEERK
ncbi:MAG: hypothetical protein ABII90_11820 [Bacteroidota bacterium]